MAPFRNDNIRSGQRLNFMRQIPFFYNKTNMNPYSLKRPRLNLDNEYTYLRGKNNKKDPLSQFSKQLAHRQVPTLPRIDPKYTNTTRKLESDLHSLKLLLLNRERKQGALSQQRHYPNYSPLMMMPMMGSYVMPMGHSQVQLPNQLPGQPNQHQPNPNIPSHVNSAPTELAPDAKNPAGQQMGAPDESSIGAPLEEGKHVKAIPKFIKRNLIRKFRVCAYAVFFSIYIKHFSKKFTENRKNWFDERYAINNGKVIFDGSAQILKQLYEVDLYKMILDGQKKAKEIDVDAHLLSKEKPAKAEFISGTANFILILLDFMKELMTSQKFIEENHEVFTVGVLTQNYMISNLYLPQEASILHIHPAGYIQIGEETEIVMLMIKIIIKITVYNYLLSLKYSRQWNLRQEKSYNLDHSDMEAVWGTIRSASVLLTIACEEIYDATKANIKHTCNFAQMAPKIGILPAKTLEEAKPKSTIQAPQPAQPTTNIVQSKFINNFEGYQDMQMLISKTPYLQKFKEKLKMKVIDFLTEVYTCLKFEEHFVYDFIRNMTMEEKYLILKAKKKELDEKAARKKKKKGRKNEGDPGSSMYGDGSIDGGNSTMQGTHRKKKNSKANRWGQTQQGEFQNGSNLSTSFVHQEDDEQDDSEEDEEENENNPAAKRRKRMRYRHEQAFYDKKFSGHSKLTSLKKKMEVIKTKKII